MRIRTVACPASDVQYAESTASQWSECRLVWTEEKATLTIDAPRLLPADEHCIADAVEAAVAKAVRVHAFVRREG